MPKRPGYLPFLILLSACGGGGDSDSDSVSSSDLFDYRLVEKPAVYKGVETRATVDGDIVAPYLDFLLVDEDYSGGLAISPYENLGLRPAGRSGSRLTTFVDSRLAKPQPAAAGRSGEVTEDCPDDGSVTGWVEEKNGTEYLHLEFDNCLEYISRKGKVVDFNVAHGKVVIFEPDFDPAIYRAYRTYRFDTLNFQSFGVSHTFNGLMHSYADDSCFNGATMFDAEIRDDNENTTYKTESLIFKQTCDDEDYFQGKIFYPKHGYLDVDTPVPLAFDWRNPNDPYSSGTLTLSGDNNSLFTLTIAYSDALDPASSKARKRHEALYVISLDVDGDSVSDAEYPMQPGILLGQPGLDLADADGDGMPNGYEKLKGLNPRKNDAHKDPDKNGKTNLQEFLYQDIETTVRIKSSFSNLSLLPPLNLPTATANSAVAGGSDY